MKHLNLFVKNKKFPDQINKKKVEWKGMLKTSTSKKIRKIAIISLVDEVSSLWVPSVSARNVTVPEAKTNTRFHRIFEEEEEEAAAL